MGRERECKPDRGELLRRVLPPSPSMTKYNFVNNAPMRVEIARNRNEAGGNNYLMRGTPGVGPFHPPTPIRVDGESRPRSANLQYVVPIVAYFNHPPPFLPSALPSPPTRINSTVRNRSCSILAPTPSTALFFLSSSSDERTTGVSSISFFFSIEL